MHFLWMKMYEFRLRFHWSLFLRVQLTKIPALVQIMAWRRPGDKPLSEPMMIILLTHICVTQPQWVNGQLLPIITWWRGIRGISALEEDKQVCPRGMVRDLFVLLSLETVVEGWYNRACQSPWWSLLELLSWYPLNLVKMYILKI